MADILVRNIPDGVVNYYKALAVQHGRSFDKEIKAVITETVARMYAEEFPSPVHPRRKKS